ncbi:MAG: sugar transferase [Acidimicrobiales bacterium]
MTATEVGHARGAPSFAALDPSIVAPNRRWVRRFRIGLVVTDTLAAGIACVAGLGLRFGDRDAQLYVHSFDFPYRWVGVVMVAAWLLTLMTTGAYDPKVLGNGSEEYRRVLSAGVRLVAAVGIVFFVFHIEIARGFIGAAIPIAMGLTVLGRFVARQWLHALRRRGRAIHRVLLVGPVWQTRAFASHLKRAPWTGLNVVGICADTDATTLDVAGEVVPVVGVANDALAAQARTNADVVVVLAEAVSGQLRELGWALEGTGVILMVAPAVTDVAGPRLSVVPVAGLPLVQINEPELSGPQRMVKDLFDRTSAGLVLVLGAPFYLLLVIAIKLDSRGPVLFRQQRVGRDGKVFTLFKLRTMCVGAHEQREALVGRNESNGVTFKIRVDPRVTRVGRFLRRRSLDELPQLWNVLRGQMSIVGPRPPLPEETELYEDHVHRRLLVKPGLTGLWQVSGRADLSWDEAVRLDLYYVDHWSPSMDAAIILKTFSAVIRGRGAY